MEKSFVSGCQLSGESEAENANIGTNIKYDETPNTFLLLCAVNSIFSRYLGNTCDYLRSIVLHLCRTQIMENMQQKLARFLVLDVF